MHSSNADNSSNATLHSAAHTSNYLEEDSEENSEQFLLARRKIEDDSEGHPQSTEQKAWFRKPWPVLRILCPALHATLIMLHVMLLGMWRVQFEHKIMFSTEIQNTISFIVKTTSTAFGTIYFALLVFITQKLAIRSYLQRSSTLTATHDNIMAWSGIGSALSTAYHQLSIPASVSGTLAVFAYLGGIAILHVTTPTLLSVATVNISTSSSVPAWGIPQWNDSNHKAVYGFMEKTLDFLPWMGTLNGSQSLGLFNGSLYDVLQDMGLKYGSAQVSATGFNITCGYLPGVNTKIVDTPNLGWSAPHWIISFRPPIPTTEMLSYGPNIISMLNPQDMKLNNSIILYTTNDVLDSRGHKGSPVTLKRPMGPNSTVSQLQILQCSKTLVTQRGTVDSQSRKLDSSTLHPRIHKTQSTWHEYSKIPVHPPDQSLIGSDIWVDFLLDSLVDWNYIPMNENYTGIGEIDYMSKTAQYLMEQLNLNPTWISSNTASTSTPVLYLHDIENAISSLIASIFWIAGHINPGSITTKYSTNIKQPGEVAIGPFLRYQQSDQPVLLAENVALYQTQSACRLELNVVAISVGLGISVLLFLLAIPYWIVVTQQTKITSTGLLHVIWLFRQHPVLGQALRQPSDPTNNHLRNTGMVTFHLSDGLIGEPGELNTVKTPFNTQTNIVSNNNEETCTFLPTNATNDQSHSVPPRRGHPKLICTTTHIIAVLLHITFLGIWASPHAEHTISFSVDHQGEITSLLTVVATSIGTIYCSLLIFLIQRMVMQRDLTVTQTLTATHDNLAAWSGLGSALASVHQQLALPAAVNSTLCILLYLSSIMVLHLSTSALFSVETFASTMTVTVPTRGLPEWNISDVRNSTNTVQFLAENLEFLSWLDDSDTIGLFNGTLHHTLEATALTGKPTQIPAVGLNVSCGYLSGVNTRFIPIANIGFGVLLGPFWEISLPSVAHLKPFLISASGPNILMSTLQETWNDTIILYTTNQVVDSVGSTGSPIQLIQPMGPNLTVSHLQFMQCSKFLANQTGMVDTQTGRIIPASLEPNIYKSYSRWQPYNHSNININSQNGSLLASGIWSQILAASTQTGVALSYRNETMWNFLLNTDTYLMEQLELDPSWIETGVDLTSGSVLKLHDIENTLSNMIAAVFWIAGHIKQASLVRKYSIDYAGVEGTAPVLSSGSVDIHVVQSAARLNLSILAVSIGLCASIILCFLAIILCRGPTKTTTSLDSMGLLHIIWLFRSHPELADRLEQVEDPTDSNLRAAGLIRVQLLSEGRKDTKPE
ncbi:hypothetical protein DFH09DRAFT_1198507 [Mycena vulgaris]|nr:hypothetical protein DFH09DRAFT_1198507 [Mycena vulgaris]